MIKRILWAISGHQREIMEETKVDNYRAMIVGAILLMVGIYATLAWTFFFSLVMKSLILAFICGMFAGFFILLFDRALICSISYGKKNIWALSFRFALALLLGIFLSQPIILKLYEPDIKREAVILIDKKNQERKAELEKVYASEVQSLKQRQEFIYSSLTAKQQQMVANEEAFKKEMDGTGGTGRWGYNTVSQKKEGIYKKDLTEYDQMKQQAEPELKRINARLDTIQALISTQFATSKETTNNQGFLIQAEALQSLLIKDKTHTLRNRYYLLMIILTLIELSALISKLILETKSYGRKVDFYIDKELQETEGDREIVSSKQEVFKRNALEKETQLIEAFFQNSDGAKSDKLRTLIEDWAVKNGHTYKDAWEILKKDLMVHDKN